MPLSLVPASLLPRSLQRMFSRFADNDCASIHQRIKQILVALSQGWRIGKLKSRDSIAGSEQLQLIEQVKKNILKFDMIILGQFFCRNSCVTFTEHLTSQQFLNEDGIKSSDERECDYLKKKIKSTEDIMERQKRTHTNNIKRLRRERKILLEVRRLLAYQVCISL